jgi:hypothetical protein
MEKANTNAADTQRYLQRFVSGKTDAAAKDLQSILHSLAPPSIYDPDISIYMLQFATRLMEHDLRYNSHVPTLYYLSSTDYLQHTYAPASPVATAFYHKLDAVLGRFDALRGATSDQRVCVGLTADHGMNDKVSLFPFFLFDWVHFVSPYLIAAGCMSVCRWTTPTAHALCSCPLCWQRQGSATAVCCCPSPTHTCAITQRWARSPPFTCLQPIAAHSGCRRRCKPSATLTVCTL